MKQLPSLLVSLILILGLAVPIQQAYAADLQSPALLDYQNPDLSDAEGQPLQDDTYQYMADGEDYTAFLWVPKQAAHLNGVMIAKSNLIEGRLLESVTVRNVLAKYRIGVIYLHARSTTDKPSNANIMGDFVYLDDAAAANYNKDYQPPANAGAVLDEMLARFAAVSGFDELRYAPLIGVGHSAGMGLGRALGSWDPSRAIAQICLKGGTKQSIPGVTEYIDQYEIQPGVPTYLAAGQFTEHAAFDNPAGKDNYIDGEIQNLSKIRAKGTDRLVTMSVEWESGHYDWSEQSNEAVANYLDQIIPARLGDQALSQEKLPENYALADLTQTGYVADPAMFGSRTINRDESEFAHGPVSNFTEAEQKTMAWFVNEEQYRFVRGFTTARKDVPKQSDTPTRIAVSYDRSYGNTSGDFSLWPAGNICYFVRDDQSIALEFDISALKPLADTIQSVTFTMPLKSGNSARTVSISQLSASPWSGAERTFAVPDSGAMTQLANRAANAIQAVDLTEVLKNTTGDKLYLNLASTDGENGSDYYCATAYDGFTCGSLTSDPSLLPHLDIEYKDQETGQQTKHQYLKMQDTSTNEPKPYTRICRYDTIGVNDNCYANGVSGDPMSFSMVADRMASVTEDHLKENQIVTESGTPVILTPVMAPVEWLGVAEEPLTEADRAAGVASKWRNYLRWKNNRVYYHTAQDSYLNFNTHDSYLPDGSLAYSYATNTFLVFPISVSEGKPQTISFDPISDAVVNDSAFTPFRVNPASSEAGMPVDLLVDYGPVKASRQKDGSYLIEADQIPAGASFPIEVKLVATQFGSNISGNKIRTAQPVEQVFYLYRQEPSQAINGSQINQNLLMKDGVTGFRTTGTGTITLKLNADTAFNADRAAAISAERAASDDPNYQKHYQYPSGYHPYDYWEDYPGEWTAEVTEAGFVPLSAFVNPANGRTNLNLRYLNEISYDPSIGTVVPATDLPPVSRLKANFWGEDGINLVWQKPQGADYDAVKIFCRAGDAGPFNKLRPAHLGASNALVTGLEQGDYTFRVVLVSGSAESQPTDVRGTVGGKNYLIEDFECGDLTSGMNWLSGIQTSAGYAGSSYMGEALLLAESESNHYLAMQNTYTPHVQTANINLPGGLTPEMKKLMLDIKVDKLEDSQPGGQVYFEFYNPVTGAAYGLEKGGDFSLEDKEWRARYTLSLDDFNLPPSAEERAGLTVLKIGRKAVGGGNNNRRAKLYLDNLTLSSADLYTADELQAVTGNGKLVLYWTNPKRPYDTIKLYLDGELAQTLDAGTRSCTLSGLTEGRTYQVKLNYVAGGTEYDNTEDALTVTAAPIDSNTQEAIRTNKYLNRFSGAEPLTDQSLPSPDGSWKLALPAGGSAVMPINGMLWALEGYDNLSLYLQTDTALTDANAFSIELLENTEDGERHAAPVGIYASVNEWGRRLDIPLEAFALSSKEGNGKLDLASIRYVKLTNRSSGSYTLRVSGMQAGHYVEDNRLQIIDGYGGDANHTVLRIETAAGFPTDAALLAASYDASGVLLDTAHADLGGFTGNASLETGQAYRVYLWDSLTGLRPLCQPAEYPIKAQQAHHITVDTVDHAAVTVAETAEAGSLVPVTVSGETVGSTVYAPIRCDVIAASGNRIPVVNGRFRMPSETVTIRPVITEYTTVSSVPASADRSFRINNTKQKGANATLEIRNSGDTVDYGFIGALKFDIADIVRSVKSNAPIDKIELKIVTERVKGERSLSIALFHNNWAESPDGGNQYENKQDYITEAVKNGKITDFSLQGALGWAIMDTSKPDVSKTTLKDWINKVDLTQFIVDYIKSGKADVNTELSLLIYSEKGNANQKCIFTKEAESHGSYDSVIKDAYQITDPSVLYPELQISYRQ